MTISTIKVNGFDNHFDGPGSGESSTYSIVQDGGACLHGRFESFQGTVRSRSALSSRSRALEESLLTGKTLECC